MVLRVFACVGLCGGLLGCGPEVAADDSNEGTTGTQTLGSSSTSSNGATTTSSTGEAESSTANSSGADSESSTGFAEPLSGPGCGTPARCTDARIEGSVRVASEADLERLRGVSVITGHFEVVDSELVCLDMLSCVTEVGATVRIQGNGALRSTAGLAGLTSVGVQLENGDGVIIADNPQLEVLEGFPLERLDGTLLLWRNESLHTSEAFGALQSLNILSVQENPLLTSLAGLHGIPSLDSCNVGHNADLCLSEIYAVCQSAQDGEVVFNDDSC